MCIAILSTAHPEYSLILINNRDEYLHRPTEPASWWSPPNEHVLGGRDLLRSVQGTWLAVTRQGRVAVLTNYRQDNAAVQGVRSRGAIANAFLTEPANTVANTEGFIKTLVEEGDGLEDVGGFSLVCGQIGNPLAIVSNRSSSTEGVSWILRREGETIALSNTTFGDRSWPKVVKGEALLRNVITDNVQRKDSKAKFIDELLKILSVDTLPRKKHGQGWEAYVRELQNSIFIPMLKEEEVDGKSMEVDRGENQASHGKNKGSNISQHSGLTGAYGTQTQTVVLVDHQGNVTFVERRLYDSTATPIRESERDRVFNFEIEGWKE